MSDDLPPLQAIKALVAGDKHPRWSDDWATGSTRSRILDIINAAEDAIEADRKKRGEPVACATFREGQLVGVTCERLPDGDHNLYSAPPVGERGEPVYWYSSDKKIIVEAKDKCFWPTATIPLYASPPVDPEKRERVKGLIRKLQEFSPEGSNEREAAALLREAYL